MLELPNLRHLRAVALVARYQSINGAADALRLSQPAVTLAIRQVEKQCGSKLFNRYKTGTYPTASGEALVQRIERCFAVFERGVIDTGEPSKEAADYAYRVSSFQMTALAVLFNMLDWTMAAEALGVTVQSVKRTVRSLELLLQSSFLLQSRSGVVFSDDGKRLARAAKLAIREIELGFEELSILRSERSGTLRIGATPLPRAQIIPEALSRLIGIYPDLRVHVQEGSYEYLLDLLRNGDIDMMVGALRGAHGVPDVFEEFLMHCPLSVVARNGHPLQQKPDLSLADTIDYQWIVNSPRAPSRALFDQAFAVRGLRQPEQLLEIGTLGVIRGLLLRGNQLTMLSRHQVRFEEEAGKLVILDIDLPETERAIGASTRIGWKPSRPQTEFMRQLKIVCDLPFEAAHGGEQDRLRLVHNSQKSSYDRTAHRQSQE